MENVIPADTKLARNEEGKYFPVADDDPRGQWALAYPLRLNPPPSPIVTLAEFRETWVRMLSDDAEWMRQHGYR